MKLVNYVEYEHSYAHAIAPKLKALNFHANVGKKPAKYVRAIILNALKDNDIYFTDKEQEFFDTIHAIQDASQLYFYCKNCVNKAKETFVYITDDGNLARVA